MDASLIPQLRAHILASIDPLVVAARTTRNDTELARLYNLSSSFIVWRKAIPTSEVGQNILYVAVASMTSLNQTRLQIFAQLNTLAFNASSDIDTMFADVFSGALGGAGAGTRAALAAMLRRAATVAEGIFVSGNGTTNSPGSLGAFDGPVTISDIGAALNG